MKTQVTAENLKSVQFGSTAWFNDQIVSNVLAKWDSLNIFVIHSSIWPYMTITVAGTL